MTSSDRKAAQQAEAQRQATGFFANLTDEQKALALAYRGPENIGEACFRIDPLRAELNEAAVAAGIRTGSMWLRPDNLRIGPGPDRPVAERN